MSMRRAGIITGVLAAVIIAAGVFVWQYRFDLQRGIERAQLPEAQEYTDISSGSLPASSDDTSTAEVAVTDLPAEANLAIPFTAQAPSANWELPYKEFCEEASVLMAMRYLQKQPIGGPNQAEADMLKIMEFEERVFGEYQDTNVVQTAAIVTDYFEYPNVSIIENPTADQIRQAVASGKPVIVPAAGRLLGNPYFQQPGPLYHMIVVKGYTSDGKFIVNDPGTRRGADFIYDEIVLMNAMHDWREDENITAGRKAVIIIG
ncbi:MAG: C39 family peptidase [Candidatus Andersenbacteria bacterium]